MTRMILFDLKERDRFEWQGRKYTLVLHGEDNAIVYEDGVEGEQNFNPYAFVTKLGE